MGPLCLMAGRRHMWKTVGRLRPPPVCHQQAQVHARRLDHAHQPAHPFLAAWAQRAIYFVITEPRRERSQGNFQVARIDTQARQGPARFQHAKRRLERRLGSEGLDRSIGTAPAGDFHDFVNDVAIFEVQSDVGAHAPRNAETMVVAPRRRAPAVAHSPIGPWANTTTTSPILILAFSAPLNPVDMMSGHIRTCSSVNPSGTGAPHRGERILRRARAGYREIHESSRYNSPISPDNPPPRIAHWCEARPLPPIARSYARSRDTCGTGSALDCIRCQRF